LSGVMGRPPEAPHPKTSFEPADMGTTISNYRTPHPSDEFPPQHEPTAGLCPNGVTSWIGISLFSDRKRNRAGGVLSFRNGN
jgi:hypothetical protein